MLQTAMAENSPLIKQLRGIGISAPYASQLASGNREPSLYLAIRIYRKLGLRMGPIAKRSDEEIRLLERVTPKPKQGQGAAA